LSALPCKVSLHLYRKNVDLIYMGPMSESAQERVVRKLTPYKEALQQQIDSGTVMLFTGNALEVLGDYMENRRWQSG